MTTPEQLKQFVRDVPDYPQKGVMFRDITPLLGDKKVFAEVVEMMSAAWEKEPPDLVAGIEARGFIPGAAIAVKLGAGFVPIRKTGKLPWSTVTRYSGYAPSVVRPSPVNVSPIWAICPVVEHPVNSRTGPLLRYEWP